MSAAGHADRPDPPLPRVSLALPCALHTVVFAWAAHTLPWNTGSAFAIAADGLALLHAATATAALAGSPRLRPIWRALSFASLLFLAWCVWQVAVSAVHVAGLYDGLGRGVATAITASLSGVVLFTLPIACWGLARTGGSRGVASGTLAFVLLATGGLLQAAVATRAEARSDLPADPAAQLERAARWLPDWETLPEPSKREHRALDPNLVVRCDHPPRAADAAPTVVVHYLAEGPNGAEARVHCAQGVGETLDTALRTRLQSEALRRPLKIDWIRATADLDLDLDAARIAPLELRPGLDGVCLGARCLMPWQLVLGDRFRAIRPLEETSDFRVGFSLDEIRSLLAGENAADEEGWTRIEVVSLAVDRAGRLQRLERLRSAPPARDPQRFARAAERAEQHIANAQRRNGWFRSGRMPTEAWPRRRSSNLPRQAGTTLAMCELGHDAERAERVARRSLARMSDYERRSGAHSFLVRKPERPSAKLGDIALPLAAFLGCRERVGEAFDALILRLGSGLLALQRPNGSFAAGFDLERGEALPSAAPLYAEGQAILALALLERFAAESGAEAHAQIRAAVDRAMDFVGGAYWDHPLRDFFFIEENWHCLAARAALGHHRHAGYEQFCLDYTRFRSRFVLRPDSGVAPDYVGGLGFGNVFAPQVVPTAGFAETLAAAIAIRRARGADTHPELELLELALDFLVAQQWSEPSCFACARPGAILGGFSESPSSPRMRIDYAQHAWAAIGHGAALLVKSETGSPD